MFRGNIRKCQLSYKTPNHQALFNLPLVSNKNLLVASIRTQVVALIFSLIIKSSAELRTVFKICACNPLKNPGTPSLFHIARITPGTVLRDFCWAFLVSLSFESTAWIMTLHLYAVKIWNGCKYYALTCNSAREKTFMFLISKRVSKLCTWLQDMSELWQYFLKLHLMQRRRRQKGLLGMNHSLPYPVFPSGVFVSIDQILYTAA